VSSLIIGNSAFALSTASLATPLAGILSHLIDVAPLGVAGMPIFRYDLATLSLGNLARFARNPPHGWERG
jgi:hypothetical protein